jgi:hypothetical protein
MSCSENKYTFINTKQKNKTRFLNIDNIKWITYDEQKMKNAEWIYGNLSMKCYFKQLYWVSNSNGYVCDKETKILRIAKSVSTNKHSLVSAKSLRPWPNMAAIPTVICHTQICR